VPAVSSVLVIGAGTAGMATAALLADRGVKVELVEAKADLSGLGSGITLQGNALRILRQLGVWEQVSAHGYGFDTIGIRAPDPAGTLVAEVHDAHTGGPDLPATFGMLRWDLARILIDRATAAGVKLRFSTTPTRLNQDERGVDVTFDDRSAARFDLVVGADGLRSWTRRAIGIDVEPAALGMGAWRVLLPRPASITRTEIVYGGPAYLAGYSPTGEDSIYAYLIEDLRHRSSLPPAECIAIIRELAAAYHGPWDDVRASLTDEAPVNYTAFESHIVPAPWNRGRVVIIGDAAHSCPPTLAQGAAMALEDAAVLSELLLSQDSPEDVWPRFTARRQERATAVITSSVQLAQWLLDHVRGDVPGLMGSVASLLTEPA
jgi:2-polyprenyl-6-methoxyphenol hydroxylase-like FAD-dependent oxidoreductase